MQILLNRWTDLNVCYKTLRKKNYWIYIKISLLLCYMIRGFKGPEVLTNCLLFNYLNKQFLKSLRSFTINKWEKKNLQYPCIVCMTKKCMAVQRCSFLSSFFFGNLYETYSLKQDLSFFIKQWALPDKYIYLQFNVIHISKLLLQWYVPPK